MENFNDIHPSIAAEEAEVIRAVRFKGMPLTRYGEVFGQPRGSIYDAIKRGELEYFKVGGRVWLTGRSIALRHRLEHLLPNEKGDAKTEAAAPPTNVTKERRGYRRSA